MLTHTLAFLSGLGCADAAPLLAPPSERTAVVYVGEAPDDGVGVHVAIGTGSASAEGCAAERPFAGPYTVLRMDNRASAPSTIVLPTFLAESFVCAGEDACEVASAGLVKLDALDDGGARGRYTLTVGGRIVEDTFDASWCGEKRTAHPHRPPLSLEGLDLAAKRYQVVAVEGWLVIHDGRPVLASELNETFPPRPAGAVVPLVADPAAFDAVSTVWSERMRGSDRPVVVEGQIREDGIHVASVAPAR